MRDAIVDSSGGNIGTDPANVATYNKGQINVSWQEDPQGLQLGGGDGPGDGASGAKVGGGTDIWYAYATVDLSVPSTPADDFVLQPAVRLTDNWTGLYGLNGSANVVYDGAGAPVDPGLLETGEAGASRPNIGMVSTTSIIAYEETKEAASKDSGKFVRYHAFPFNAPPATVAGKAGCIISDPAKNGRRVRFLTQSPDRCRRGWHPDCHLLEGRHFQQGRAVGPRGSARHGRIAACQHGACWLMRPARPRITRRQSR